MSSSGGFVTGVLALTALGAIGSSRFATGSIGAGLTTAAELIRRWSDPDIPAIPDLRSRIAAQSGAGVTAGGTAGTAPSAATSRGGNRTALKPATKIPHPTYPASPRTLTA